MTPPPLSGPPHVDARETLEHPVADCSHERVLDWLRWFRGTEIFSSAGLCAETGGLDRSPRPTVFVGVLGIVPASAPPTPGAGKPRSPSPAPLGTPTAGRGRQEYPTQPAISQTLARRHQGQDPPITGLVRGRGLGRGRCRRSGDRGGWRQLLRVRRASSWAWWAAR